MGLLKARVAIDVFLVAPLMLYGGWVARKATPGYGTALMGAGALVLAFNSYKLLEEEACDCGE